MFGTSVGLRRAVALSRPSAIRNFSLLVPIQSPPKSLPADVQTTPLSDAYFAGIAQKHADFNEACKAELKEMNENIIDNIMNRGGNDGWDTSLDRMVKTFEFSSFEQCQAFCTAVSIEANKKDHHPEWKLTNNGCTLQVTLTSHFAGNKVTRLDFELAEEMNEQYERTLSSFKMFPYFSSSEWASIKIALGVFVFGTVLYRFSTGTKYPMRSQDPEKYPTLPMDLAKIELPRTQVQADLVSVQAAIYNRNKFYETRSENSPVPGL